MTDRAPRRAALQAALEARILVLDGAWGTMIQALALDEAGFRGARFEAHGHDLQGNNDILNLTQPEAIQGIGRAYLEAGADIVSTNTFNANRISQADYGCESAVVEINREGARLARAVADAWTLRTPDRARFVAGALGPTNKTATLSPDVNDPGFRNVSFEDLAVAYAEATRALVAGGADIILLETIFDTLNAKAALFAVESVFDEVGFTLPIMISGTITDRSGRTLTGQTPEAFWYSLRHVRPLSIGLNCSLGAKEMRSYVAELARVAEVPVSAYPNAGLPNAFGGYDQTPAEMAAHLREWAASGLVNIVGGCCGSTPEHIRAIARAVAGLAPRRAPERPRRLRLSGLEAVEVAP